MQCDQALPAWLGLLRSTRAGFGDTTPQFAAASLMEDTLFPNGVAPITRLPYVDQHGEVDVLLDRVREESALADAATTLNLTPMLTRLTDINAAYGAALSRSASPLTYAQLRALDRDAWRSAVSVIVRILGAFPDPTEEHEEAVRTLLEPYTVQAAEFSKLRQRRAGAGLFDFEDEESDVEPAPSEDETPDDEAPNDAPVEA